MTFVYVPPALTETQCRAVQMPGPLIVSASAGSGKTRVLVERYIRLMLEGCDLRRIVAMTFTRKAAAEMLERAATRLDRLFDVATEPEHLLLLRTLRERLMSAQVSTFHSYCSSLLRRFPIEAKVPPTFGELSPADAATLVRDAIRLTVEEWIGSNRRDDLADLLNVFGSYARLERCLQDILSSPQRLDALRSDTDHHVFLERASKAIREIIAEQRAFWRELFNRAQSAELPPRVKRPPASAGQVLSEIESVNFDLLQFGDIDASWRHALNEALALFHTSNQPNLRSPWSYVATHAEARQAAKRATVIAAVLGMNIEVEQQAWRAQQMLLALARETLQRIDHEKSQHAAFEPDDLQRRALALLDDDTVRSRLVWEIQHILVDEFQDTDPIQYELLHRLIPLPNLYEDLPELFIVGDPKQSIYGFRGADVRVFERARHDITTAAGSDADVHLQTSFRMTPPLVAVVNTVMRSVMPTDTRGYAVGYEELCTARPAQSCPKSRVALLISMPEGTSEADLVAQHIVQITSTEPLTVWDEHLNTGSNTRGGIRTAQYRDIALLARKSRTFEQYVRALRQASIPFRIESGRGFYQTQEVLDVLAFLRVVHNRHDDVALATLLRSPFIGLSDSELACIASSHPRHGSLAERLAHAVATSSASESVVEAARLLEEILPIAVRMPPTALIRLLLRRTPWYARVWSSPRALQIEANIEKLLEAARQFEQRGFRNLLDFVEELEQLRLVADTEAEAAVISDDNVVTLMTIHAAKGLEFPIVYLVGTNQSARRRSDPVLMTEELGISIRTVGDGEPTATGAIAQYFLQQRDDAEEQRLLYVALTRAKDHLFIAGALSKSRTAESVLEPIGYLGDISAAFGIEWSTQPGIRNVTIADCVRADPNDIGRRIEVPIEIIYSLPAARAPQQTQPIAPRPLMVEPVLSAVAGEIVSATQLLLFEKSPKEFYRVYRCGLPSREDTDRRALARFDDGDDVIGSLAGRVIHRTLEMLLRDRRYDAAACDAALERAMNEFRCSHDDSLRARVRQDVRATVDHLAAQRLLVGSDRDSHAYIEQPIMMAIGSDFLLGVPDVLIKTPLGWEIWDWKTNRHDHRTAAEWLDYYQTQLEVYLVLAASAIPEQDSFTARLVMTRPPVEAASLTVNRADIVLLRQRIAGLVERIKQTSLNGH